MHIILKVILVSVGVAIALCSLFLLESLAFQDRINFFGAGILAACVNLAVWMLLIKELTQSRNTKRERELDDLSSINDELIRIVRKDDAFSFSKCSVTPGDTAFDYSWVIQSKTFDFNAAIVKVKLRPEHPFDENRLRKQIKTDLKQVCGGWFMRPLVLGVVLETSGAESWQADSIIDHNYAGGVGIGWVIIVDECTMNLSRNHYPKKLPTTTFYDKFVSHFLEKGYVLSNSTVS